MCFYFFEMTSNDRALPQEGSISKYFQFSHIHGNTVLFQKMAQVYGYLRITTAFLVFVTYLFF